MDLLAGTLKMMHEDKDLALKGALPLHGIDQRKYILQLGLASGNGGHGGHSSIRHSSFLIQSLCLGKSAMNNATNKWKNRYTANRDYYKADFSTSIIGEPLEI